MIWTCQCGCRVDDPSNGASGTTCAECMANGGAALTPKGFRAMVDASRRSLVEDGFLSESGDAERKVAMMVTQAAVAGLDLDALEAKAREATPGPWRVVDRSGEDGSPMYDDEAFVAFGPEEYEGHQRDSTVLTGANARFIAAASPDVVLALVERVRVAEVNRETTDRRLARRDAEGAAALDETGLAAAEAALTDDNFHREAAVLRGLVARLRAAEARDVMLGLADASDVHILEKRLAAAEALIDAVIPRCGHSDMDYGKRVFCDAYAVSADQEGPRYRCQAHRRDIDDLTEEDLDHRSQLAAWLALLGKETP